MTGRELYEIHRDNAAGGEPLREAMQRVVAGTASAEDLIAFIRWELWEAVYSLPPEAPESRPVDGFHASACVSRALSAVSLLAKKAHP